MLPYHCFCFCFGHMSHLAPRSGFPPLLLRPNCTGHCLSCLFIHPWDNMECQFKKKWMLARISNNKIRNDNYVIIFSSADPGWGNNLHLIISFHLILFIIRALVWGKQFLAFELALHPSRAIESPRALVPELRVDCTKCGGPRTPSTTTDANLYLVFAHIFHNNLRL